MNELNLAPDFIDRTINALTRAAEVFDMEHLPFVGIAVVPVLIWLYIFFRHQRENKLLTFLIFIAGMFAVIPIFIFEPEIGRIAGRLKNLFANVFLTIMLTNLWVGFYEETAKYWIMKSTGRHFFRNIDDAIIFSIVVALGFAFIENILYFYRIWNNSMIEESMRWFYIFLRPLSSMLLHIFASGILGYYFGIAYFAKPVLQDKLTEGKRFIFTKWIHRILHLKSETVFREEKILEGLLIATSLHATFDFLMGMSQHFTDIGSPGIAKFWLLAAAPFLVGGFFLLTYLLDKKEDHKIYRELEERDVLEKDENIKVQKKEIVETNEPKFKNTIINKTSIGVRIVCIFYVLSGTSLIVESLFKKNLLSLPLILIGAFLIFSGVKLIKLKKMTWWMAIAFALFWAKSILL